MPYPQWAGHCTLDFTYNQWWQERATIAIEMAQPNCWNDRKDHLNQLKFQKDCENKKTNEFLKTNLTKGTHQYTVQWLGPIMQRQVQSWRHRRTTATAMLLVECMDNAEQDATMLKGRLHEIGSAGGEFSGNKKISWRFREVNFRNRLKFCRQRRVKTMASEGHVGTCSESFILALEFACHEKLTSMELKSKLRYCINEAQDRRVLENPKFFPPLFLHAKVLTQEQTAIQF